MKSDKEILVIAQNLDKILQKGNVTLVDEFEKEFSKLEHEKETSSMILFGNRLLVRQAYNAIVFYYGNKATLIDFQRLVENSEGIGDKILTELIRKDASDIDMKRNQDIYAWFKSDYYKSMEKGRGDYVYALPTRYMLRKFMSLLDSIEYDYIREETKKTTIIDNNNQNIEDWIM